MIENLSRGFLKPLLIKVLPYQGDFFVWQGGYFFQENFRLMDLLLPCYYWILLYRERERELSDGLKIKEDNEALRERKKGTFKREKKKYSPVAILLKDQMPLCTLKNQYRWIINFE